MAIIGAGLAGLSCGTALKGLVPEVRVFEKDALPEVALPVHHDRN